MALRRKEKKVRKLNRTIFRRPAGRTAEFFDLRESEENTGTANRTDTYSGEDAGAGRYTGRASGVSRPYRERHRVEVNTQNTRDSYSGQGSYTGRDSYFGQGSYSGRDSYSGQGSYTGRDNYYNRELSPSETDRYTGRDSYSGGQRIVHGNAPGSRTARTDSSDTKELSSDLLYSRGSSRPSRGRNTAGNTAGRFEEERTRTSSYSAGAGRTSRYGRNTDSGSSRYSQNTDSRTSRYGRNTDSGSSRYSQNTDSRTSRYGRNTDSSSSRYGRNVGSSRYEEDSYDDMLQAEELEYEHLFDDKNAYDYPDEEEEERRIARIRRARQRDQARKKREQQLRGYYIKIGIGAVVLLFLLIFVAPRVVRTIHSSKEEQESLNQGQAAASAEENAGTQVADAQTDEENPADLSTDEEDTVQEDTVQEEAVKQQDSEEAAKQQDSEEEAASETEESQEAADGSGQDAEAEETTEDTEQKEAGQTDPEQSEQAGTGETDLTQAGADAQKGATAEAESEQTATADSTEDAAASSTTEAGIDLQSLQADLETAAASGRYAKQDDWRFVLVNPWYLLPEGYEEVATSSLPNGESVDTRCYGELVDMLDDCKEAGGQPVVCSSYRPHSKQIDLYEDQVKYLMSFGMSKEEAEVEAGTTVALPGTSEHEIGLAVDICDFKNQNLDDTQAETTTQKWLMEHSWEYGFILRYPEDKSDLTGIIYEPWHYRYVGKEAAKEITEQEICLEEYLTQ